jgi:hypothetical protein
MKFLFYLAVILGTFLTSCSPSSEDIAEELGPKIKKDICTTLKINEKEVELINCELTHESGNKYNGILKTKYNGMTQTFKLNVTYEPGGKYTADWELLNEV